MYGIAFLTLLSREIGDRAAIYYPDNNSEGPYSLVAFSLITIRFTAVAKATTAGAKIAVKTGRGWG